MNNKSARASLDAITHSAQQRNMRLATQSNDIALYEALQRGYAMACSDHDLPVPEFDTPESFVEKY